MPEQAAEKMHHGSRHAGHLDQQAKEHEQRHRKQDEVRHSLVHPSNQDDDRQARRQRQIAEGGEPEAEGDGYAAENEEAGDPDKKDDKIEIAQSAQYRLERKQPRSDQDDDAETQADECPAANAEELEEGYNGH